MGISFLSGAWRFVTDAKLNRRQQRGRRLARKQFSEHRRRALPRIFLHQLFDQQKRFGGSVYAFLALPKPRRDAICAVYAFMRRADDISDDESLPREKRRAELS